MSDRVFFDSNILIYAFGPVEARKSSHSQRLILEGAVSQNAVVSYQVLQEFLNVAFKKFRPPVTVDVAREYLDEIVADLEIVPWSPVLLKSALLVRGRYQLSWYDCLIVAAALEARCEILYTEDLQHGQRFGDLLVVNPFL